MIGTASAVLASAVIGAGASLIGAGVQSNSIAQGMEIQDRANRRSERLIKRMDKKNRKAMKPWREAGREALETLKTGIENGDFDPSNFDFEADPGYQFRLDQGQKAVERSAAARGNLLSGSTAVALNAHAQGLASDEYDRAYNRNASEQVAKYNMLAGLAGTGQRANEFTVNGNTNSTNALVGNITTGANVQANGWNNIGASWTGGIGNTAGAVNTGLENYLLYNALGNI